MALACERAVRWPGTMVDPAPEADVRALRDRGLQLVPDGDLPERAQLLSIKAGWPFAYPEDVDEDDLAPYREAGLQAADIARRLGDVDLESGVLDQAAATDCSRAATASSSRPGTTVRAARPAVRGPGDR